MREKIEQRIAELMSQLEEIVEEREALIRKMDDLNMQIAKHAGTIQELDSLLKEEPQT